MGRPLNDGVTPVLAAVHRSSTSRGHAARETQIIIVLARRLLVGERLVTVVDKPGQHLRLAGAADAHLARGGRVHTGCAHSVEHGLL